MRRHFYLNNVMRIKNIPDRGRGLYGNRKLKNEILEMRTTYYYIRNQTTNALRN